MKLRCLSAISERSPRYLPVGRTQHHHRKDIEVSSTRWAGVNWARRSTRSASWTATGARDAGGAMTSAGSRACVTGWSSSRSTWSRSSVRTVSWSSGFWVGSGGDPRPPGRRDAPRFTASGAKTDSFDAFVLAKLARTDSHRFRVLTPRQRRHQGAQGAEPPPRGSRSDAGLANKLRAQLETFWPAAAGVCRHRQPSRTGVHLPLPQSG